MRKISLLLLVTVLLCSGLTAQQSAAPDYTTMNIQKKVSDYPDTYDLSTPVKGFVSLMNLYAHGRQGMLAATTSATQRSMAPKAGSPDREVPEETKNMLLSLSIEEVIVYRDSVAGVVSRMNDDFYIMRMLSREEGKWLNAGENIANSLEGARSMFHDMAPVYTGFIRSMSLVENVSTDTLAFVNYVKQAGHEPREFLLNKLANHKLVIYGEYHKRKASWDLIKSVINTPSFPQNTGVVFLEMSSDLQPKMDRLFAGNTMSTELLLDILRSVQLEGWDDKGMYEVVADLWKINQKLPKAEKVDVVLVDIPRPFSEIITSEEFQDHFMNRVKDRNVQMADIVEEGLKKRTDTRGGIFIVGAAHAYKARVAMYVGGSSVSGKDAPELSAGAQLKQRFSEDDVYITFGHGAVVDNLGNTNGFTRRGIFDYAFAQNGNKPVAFDLAGSPFGNESFDAFIELRYTEGLGSYANNYDGYIFLKPLAEEGAPYLLQELVNEDFLKELKRRSILMGYEGWQVYGAPIKGLTMDDVRRYYSNEAASKYWKGLQQE